jgi:ketosteroid isomerase-like protein
LTETDRATTIRRFYDAFNRRDVDAVLAALVPDVAWPNLIDNITIHGPDAVRTYWLRQFETTAPNVEPTAIHGDADVVVVQVHQVIRDLAGSVLQENDVVHTCTFRDDLVVAMQLEDGLIPANPCTVKNAGVERAPERSVATVWRCTPSPTHATRAPPRRTPGRLREPPHR